MDDKDNLRSLIDEVDSELLVLLNKRASLVIELWKLKQAQNIPLYDREREISVGEKACRANQGPLTPSAVIQLYKCIMEQSRHVAALQLGCEEPDVDNRR